jgi:hypothetical protein
LVPKLHYCHDSLEKKTNKKKLSQNDQVLIDLSKMTFWSSWTWGQKNHMGALLTKIPDKKSYDFL